MPTLIAQTEYITPSQVPARKRWSREDCALLEAAGLLAQEKLELVDGELISKMGKNRPHVKARTWMLIWLQDTFGREFVNSEAPIDVSPNDNTRNEPEPDLIVLRRKFAFYDSNPRPEEIRLVVEISDSTLDFDLTVKARLYARGGIAEYWVFDIAGKRLIAHREPVAGVYSSVMAFGGGESLAPLSAPGARFRVADAFGG